MELAVLHRLQHILPAFPSQIVYAKGTGTADNIAPLLSLTDGSDRVVIFPDWLITMQYCTY